MSSEPSHDEVIELALRKQAQLRAAAREQEQAQRLAGLATWRWLFLGLLAALLLAIVLFPNELPLNMRLYSVVHGICAQEHNTLLGGMQLPLCARNTGIYGGFLLTLGLLALLDRGRAARLPPWSITLTLGLLVVLMAVDGFNSLFKDMHLRYLYEPFNPLRTLSGLGAGTAMAVFVLLVLNNALRQDARFDQRIIGNWAELGAALGLGMLLLLAIYGGLSWAFWLVAAISFFGITGLLLLVNTLIVSLIMGYESAVTHWSQLVRPATVGLLVTVLMLAATSTLRFWLEANGYMPS